ncbi:MAG TPA: hypothetical protein VI485_23085 [Vicinamibacterales bacterium]|nr:hypothetical protein [Vicinamibacterales bacterium]
MILPNLSEEERLELERQRAAATERQEREHAEHLHALHEHASYTAYKYAKEADCLCDVFEPGLAAAPAVVAAFINACAQDFHTSVMQEEVRGIRDALHQIAAALERLEK